MPNFITKPEWKIARSIKAFSGATAHPMHLTGYNNYSDESVIAINGRDGTTTMVNHNRKVVVVGADSDISIAEVAKGYKVVTFRMSCLMTAMLVDEYGIGSIPCTTVGKKTVTHNGLRDDGDYVTYYSESLSPTTLDVGDDDDYELLISIAKAMRKHYDNASNSFSLYCSNEEIEEYKTLLDTLESMINEEAVA